MGDQATDAPDPRRRRQARDNLTIHQLKFVERDLTGKDYKGDGKAPLLHEMLDHREKMRLTVPVVAVDETHFCATGSDVVGEVILDDMEPALAPDCEQGHLVDRHTATPQMLNDGAGFHRLELFQSVCDNHCPDSR